MAIKAVDPIGEIGVAREVKMLQAQTRRPSQGPAQPETPNNTVLVNTATEADKAKADQKQPEQQAPPLPVEGPSLRFHVDQETGKTVTELVGPDGQILRQVPTEEALQIAKAIGKYQGMFVDLKI